MDRFHCGLDFGTTNCSVAVSNGHEVRVLDLDPLNDNPQLLPSLLYLSRKRQQIVGRAAADAFIARNIGREVVVKQVDLGIDIEAYVGAEPDKSEGYRPSEDKVEVREAVRARATVEVDSPGRLFQSLKTALRHVGFRGTEVFGEWYQIEALIALILRSVKEVVDRAAGHSMETVVLGRPVRFSKDPHEDAIAERRLRTAALLAGFKDVVFFFEPVAACIEYAITTQTQQRLLVVDIGGGTCDVCVMEFGGAQGATPSARLAESRILGIAGAPTAGDAIDREITRVKLFPSFGSQSRYGPSNLPMPQYLFNAIVDWQNLYRLNTEDIIHWLIAVETSSTQPQAIRALRYLIQRNYGYLVTREVELAKKRLSDDIETWITIEKEDIRIHERLERAEFAHIIEYMLEEMRATIDEAEAAAQLKPQDIDWVLTTGGTSLVPAVRQMLEARYGAGRILHRDTFTSVATGLALVAQYTG